MTDTSTDTQGYHERTSGWGILDQVEGILTDRGCYLPTTRMMLESYADEYAERLLKVIDQFDDEITAATRQENEERFKLEARKAAKHGA